MAVQLSVKAKENLERIAESRKKDSKFVRLEPGEKTTLHFDAEKIEPVEVEFGGALIDTYLAEGQSILKIHRIGAGKDTQYAISPA